MRAPIFSTLVLCLLGCFAIRDLAQEQSDAASIRTLESKWADAYKQRQIATLASLLAEDYVITMEDGSAIILSVAKYYSPEGKSIQDNGVTPDIPQAETDANADIPADDSLPDLTPDDAVKKPGADELLNKAIQVLQ